MFEWISGDPLNGIVITITFFISFIIGTHLGKMKKTAYREIEPRIRILVSFMLIISLTLMKHWYIPAAVSLFAVIIAARVRTLHDYSRKMVFPLVFGLFILVIQGLTYGTRTIAYGHIQLHPEGLEYGLLVFSRVVASASVLVLLILTTPENELLESMRWFRFPPTLIQIMSFMVCYIKTFSNEGAKLKLAQQSRCSFPERSSFPVKIRNIASVGGVLITRAFSRSDEVYRAMVSRGWNPGIKCLAVPVPLKPEDIVTGIVLFTGIIALTGIDMVI